ncbi:hypothetical protein [Marinomonas sp. FW-1]|uniref:hypothetical protein n=1 Tax=Pseudomonadati TaxID=3379134 RepID=UPI0010C0A0C0|nr:hypothetical protein [Marinomonas sp. FW-1]
MISQDVFSNFIGSALETLSTLGTLKADDKLHAFTGSTDATTGYYRLSPDGKECSVTVDYFYGGHEGTATFSFVIERMEAPKCH